jgi:hypothetical protein
LRATKALQGVGYTFLIRMPTPSRIKITELVAKCAADSTATEGTQRNDSSSTNVRAEDVNEPQHEQRGQIDSERKSAAVQQKLQSRYNNSLERTETASVDERKPSTIRVVNTNSEQPQQNKNGLTRTHVSDGTVTADEIFENGASIVDKRKRSINRTNSEQPQQNKKMTATLNSQNQMLQHQEEERNLTSRQHPIRNQQDHRNAVLQQIHEQWQQLTYLPGLDLNLRSIQSYAKLQL